MKHISEEVFQHMIAPISKQVVEDYLMSMTQEQRQRFNNAPLGWSNKMKVCYALGCSWESYKKGERCKRCGAYRDNEIVSWDDPGMGGSI